MRSDAKIRALTLATILAVIVIFWFSEQHPKLELVLEIAFGIVAGLYALAELAMVVGDWRRNGPPKLVLRDPAPRPKTPGAAPLGRSMLWFALAAAGPAGAALYLIPRLDRVSTAEAIGVVAAACIALGVGLLFGVRETNRAAREGLEEFARNHTQL